MATFRKRGTSWRAEIVRLGVRDAATFDTKTEAQAWAVRREAEIIAGVKGVIAGKTLRDAFSRYSAEVSPTKAGEHWEKVRLARFSSVDGGQPFMHCIDKLITEVTPNDIAAWRNKRLESVKGSSVAREMKLMNSVFEIARKEWGWILANPMNDVKRPSEGPPRDRRVSDDERDRMIMALGYEFGTPPQNKSQQVAVAFLLAIETAMRAGELTNLAWDRVYLKQRYVTLEVTKNGDRRDVPLSRAAVDLFELMPRTSKNVFDVSAASVDGLWRKARARAGIEDLHFHDSRHEALTRLARKLHVLELARMVGHRDPRSLMIYYNATAAELAARLD